MNRLFKGIFPTGICYADRKTLVKNDYLRVAFLFFDTLKLELHNPPPELLPEIEADAAEIQASKGQSFQIDSCGHTVMLGDGRAGRVS